VAGPAVWVALPLVRKLKGVIKSDEAVEPARKKPEASRSLGKRSPHRRCLTWIKQHAEMSRPPPGISGLEEVMCSKKFNLKVA
jgi:hypothetical protein